MSGVDAGIAILVALVVGGFVGSLLTLLSAEEAGEGGA